MAWFQAIIFLSLSMTKVASGRNSMTSVRRWFRLRRSSSARLRSVMSCTVKTMPSEMSFGLMGAAESRTSRISPSLRMNRVSMVPMRPCHTSSRSMPPTLSNSSSVGYARRADLPVISSISQPHNEASRSFIQRMILSGVLTAMPMGEAEAMDRSRAMLLSIVSCALFCSVISWLAP